MLTKVLKLLADWEFRFLRRYSDTLVKVESARSLVGRRLAAHGHRTPVHSPTDAPGTPSSERINRLLAVVGAEAYLEIGIQDGYTLEAVHASVVEGVDPAHSVNIARLPEHMRVNTRTSDAFFSTLKRQRPSSLYDIIFVDGLHSFEQSYRDVINAFAALRPRGIVVVDDTVPPHDLAALPDRELSKRLQRERGLARAEWMGDVFRTVLAVKRFHPDVRVATVEEGDHRGQTLMWSAGGETLMLKAPEPSALGEIRRESFERVFGNGVPQSFEPMSLETALVRWDRDQRSS